MLSFITPKQKAFADEWHLNTSHVIFYREKAMEDLSNRLFKYISCYLLSRDSMGRYSRDGNLNTSHVIFYQQE